MRIFLAFILTLLISCSSSLSSNEQKRVARHDYKEVEHLSISYLDAFDMKEERYYLYYYQTTCSHCLEIKDYIIDYALRDIEKIYFIRIEKDEGFLSSTISETLFTNDPLKSFMMVTPQLSLVENGYVTKTVVGKKEILLIIE